MALSAASSGPCGYGTIGDLPDRELSAGLAEVIKYALLGDVEFLDWLEQHMDGLIGRDATLLAEAVYRSCAHKARIIFNDEKRAR